MNLVQQIVTGKRFYTVERADSLYFKKWSVSVSTGIVSNRWDLKDLLYQLLQGSLELPSHLQCEVGSEHGCFKEGFANPVVEVMYMCMIPFKYYKMLREAPTGSISLTHKRCRMLQDAEVDDLHNRSWALRSKKVGTAVLWIVRLCCNSNLKLIPV